MSTIYYDNDLSKAIEKEINEVRDHPVSMVQHGYWSRQEMFDAMLDIIADHLHVCEEDVKEAIKALDITRDLDAPTQKEPFENLMEVYAKDKNCYGALLKEYKGKVDYDNARFVKDVLAKLHRDAEKKMTEEDILEGSTPFYIVSIDGEENPSYITCRKVVISSIDDIEKALHTNDTYEIWLHRYTSDCRYIIANVEREDEENAVYFLVPVKWVDSIPQTDLIRKIIDFFDAL